MPQVWALGAWGSSALCPLAPGFLPGGPFGLVQGGSVQVGRPVGVLPPWGVIMVAAPWPMGTQPPLATQALNTIKSYLM